jgi:Zn finger protein HypA/HybF involved in hydrogenase expression
MTIEIPIVKKVKLNIGKPKPLEFTTENEWEFCLLICPKGHSKKLSIRVGIETSGTYCAQCGKAQRFKRHSLTNGVADT